MKKTVQSRFFNRETSWLAFNRRVLDEGCDPQLPLLEIHRSASRPLVSALAQYLGLDRADIYPIDGPVELRALLPLAQAEGFDALRDEPWLPVPSPAVDNKEPLFPQIAERDILLIHPYETFDPVVKFLEDAAGDPDVLAIKQVLYRTAPASAIIEALILAALAGKHVTVLIDLKARFDEGRNIGQARTLEQAGVQVVYGVRGICCLRPGVKRLSENIEVVSIIDRFLEHARIFSFYNGGHERVFISSADGMPRNLDKRVELMVPILSAPARKRLQSVLKVYFRDNVKSHVLLSDGTYRRCRSGGKATPCRSQRALFEEAQSSVRLIEQVKPTRLEPYRQNLPPKPKVTSGRTT